MFYHPYLSLCDTLYLILYWHCGTHLYLTKGIFCQHVRPLGLRVGLVIQDQGGNGALEKPLCSPLPLCALVAHAQLCHLVLTPGPGEAYASMWGSPTLSSSEEHFRESLGIRLL